MKIIFKKRSIVLSLSLLASSAMGLQHQDKMWGLKNTGQNIYTSINPLQTYQLQAVAGEDINLASPRKGRKVKVAILDTGVDVEHPDLKDLIYHPTGKCEALAEYNKCVNEKIKNKEKNAVDLCRAEMLKSEENVYPADCNGWSILYDGDKKTPNNIIGKPDFIDNIGHGTHVAGIVAQVTNNIELISVQVVGNGPNAPIKPFSIDLSPNENNRKGYKSEMNSERVARGVIYAMNIGAEVINLSTGWPESGNTDIVKEAIAEAQRRGVIIVAAAGNDSTTSLLRPCQYKGVICVGAHAPDGSIASFSNFGPGVDLLAPGVEITSTIPMGNRSIRIPGYKGYDMLSGTSQAAPYVAGVAAEMLSRGIPSSEIYARLVLGTRKVKSALPILVGPIGGKQVEKDGATKYSKTIISGLLDMQNALAVNAQPLILSADKDVKTIMWDRKSTDLKFTMSLKNYWSDVKDKKIQIIVKNTEETEIDPDVVSVSSRQTLQQWLMGEEKEFEVNLKIKDEKDGSLSRMPSELSYEVSVMLDGKLHRKFEVRADVLVGIGSNLSDRDANSFNLVGQVPRGMKLLLVDDVFDGKLNQRDYFVLGKDADGKSMNIALARSSEKNYQIEETKKMQFDGDLSMTSPHYRMRIDLDGNGESEYIFGVIEYLDKKQTIYGDYRNHFYIFDNKMNLLKTVLFDDKRVSMPKVFYWLKVNGQMRPAWVGKGQEIKSVDVTDLWSTDSEADTIKKYKTKSDIHCYYLDENFKLQQLKAEESVGRIVDIIQPSIAASRKGELTVLIAKNLGTELKPSYINDFSIGTISNGKVENIVKLNSVGQGLGYRNLVDTYADRLFSLSHEDSAYRGIIWYGLDAHQQQRVTLFDVEEMKIFDKIIESETKINDALLLVKSGFQSGERRGVFALTNSEIEYHDLNSDQVVSSSMNRYSFIGDANVEIQFPITLIDRKVPTQKLPAIYTTEKSAVASGLRMLVPLYNKEGQIQKMITPARLRFKTEAGCRPLEAPVFLGEEAGYAMDYHCGNKILRVSLKY